MLRQCTCTCIAWYGDVLYVRAVYCMLGGVLYVRSVYCVLGRCTVW